MRRIRSKDTKPELIVRSLVHRLGYRYRLHRRDLPGKPDLVFGPRRKIIFVHGCFWHQHQDPKCLDGRSPRSNTGYWSEKLARNVQRDRKRESELRELGWEILVIWECQTSDLDTLTKRLREFLAT